VAPLGSIQIRQADTVRLLHMVVGKGCKHLDFIHAQWATVLKTCGTFKFESCRLYKLRAATRQSEAIY